MKKIIGITGGKGAGKSTAAVSFIPPSEMDRLLVVDTEDSFSSILEETAEAGFPIGTYINMYDRFNLDGDTEDMLDKIATGSLPWVSTQHKKAWAEYYDYFVSRINQELKRTKDGKPLHKYIIIDTMGKLLTAMVAAIEDNPSKFGWSRKKAYGKLETEGVRPLWENLFEAFSQRGIELVILTSHLKSVWVNDKPVIGKVKPGGRTKLLSQYSSLWLWMVKTNNQSGARAAIVLKARSGKMRVNKETDSWEPTQILPARIPFFDNWRSVWKRYSDNPADLQNPAPGEVMTAEERDTISEMLNDKQMQLMILDSQIRLKEEENQGGILMDTAKDASTQLIQSQIEMLLQENPNITVLEISKQVMRPVPIVNNILKKIKDGSNG